MISDETDTLQYNDTTSVMMVIDDAARSRHVLEPSAVVKRLDYGGHAVSVARKSVGFDGGNMGSASVPKYMVSNHI